jgi:hypothetical protein
LNPAGARCLLAGLHLELVCAGIEELAELDDAAVVVATLLPQESLVILVEVLSVRQGLVIAADLLQEGVSLQALRHLEVERHQRGLGKVKLDEAAVEDLGDAVLVGELERVASEAIQQARAVEVAREAGQVAKLERLHDGLEALSRVLVG